MVSTKGKNSMLVTKELVEKMTVEYDLRNKHEVKRKVQLQFLRQVIQVQVSSFSRLFHEIFHDGTTSDAQHYELKSKQTLFIS